MQAPNYNIPNFSAPIGYRHKIDPNAAWIKPKSSPNLLPPMCVSPGPTTQWGTPPQIWQQGEEVLFQVHPPDGEWFRSIIIRALYPLEIERFGLSMSDVRNLPPSRRAKMFCTYVVKIIDEDRLDETWTEVEERVLVPTYLDETLKANAPQFMVGEQVMVHMSAGDNRRTYTGRISNIIGYKVIRHGTTWNVIPSLYKVYIDELNTSGHWTANSITSIDLSGDEDDELSLSPPTLVATNP